MITTDQISDLFEGAITQLEGCGWTQGQLCEPDTLHPFDCRVDLRGALAVAAGRHPEFVDTYPLYCENGRPTAADEDALERISAAEEAFAGWLRRERGYVHAPGTNRDLIDDWNDEEFRTAEQVITALRECVASLAQAVSL